MVWLNSISHLERRAVARRMQAVLIGHRLDDEKAVAAIELLVQDALSDWRQLRWLLLPPSTMIH